MPSFIAKASRLPGLSLAVALVGSAPLLTGYDAATGASNTTSAPPATPTVQRIVAQARDTAGSSAQGKFTRTITGKKQTFSGSLRIPLPNAALGLADATAAQSAEILLRTSRQGTAYAECALDFAGVGGKPRAAHYRLNLVKRRGTVQQKTGFCELSVAPVGPGLPQPQARDTLTLVQVTPDGEQTFARGAFVKK